MLSNLRAPSADAESLGEVLRNPEIGDFAVEVISNEPSHITQAHVEDLFAESKSDDVILLHFSCHGLKNDSGALFFAAPNTRPDRLGSTAIPAVFVQQCMRSCRSRSIVVLLDCCYGGAFARGVAVRSAAGINALDSFPLERLSGRGRAVITASSAMEYAFEGNELASDERQQPSVFTAALVEGLATGDADRDSDGWISLNELYDYVFDKVRERNPHQTPSRQFEMQGELYLARSRKRPLTAAMPDLQSALSDLNMYARLGAISEYRSQLLGPDIPLARKAHKTLTVVASTDVQQVANAASEALSAAAPIVRPAQLNFGRVDQGAAQPRKTVQLVGPPIARACTPLSSADWIKADVNSKEGQIYIRIDTNHIGKLHGNIELESPTGKTAITVRVDIVDSPKRRGARLDEVSTAYTSESRPVAAEPPKPSVVYTPAIDLAPKVVIPDVVSHEPPTLPDVPITPRWTNTARSAQRVSGSLPSMPARPALPVVPIVGAIVLVSGWIAAAALATSTLESDLLAVIADGIGFLALLAAIRMLSATARLLAPISQIGYIACLIFETHGWMIRFYLIAILVSLRFVYRFTVDASSRIHTYRIHIRNYKNHPSNYGADFWR